LTDYLFKRHVELMQEPVVKGRKRPETPLEFVIERKQHGLRQIITAANAHPDCAQCVVV